LSGGVVMLKQQSTVLGIIDKYRSDVSLTLGKLPTDKIAEVVDVLAQARQNGNRVFIFGNGGSATTASHFASDLSKGAIADGKPRIKAFALNDNVPMMTAWANDTAYENIFAEQVENCVDAGDVVVGISCSGNSPNVLKGVKAARAKGATVIGFVGCDGGKLIDLVNVAIAVPCTQIEQVEDIHLLLEHVITTCLREAA
jgi:D-sedoheptulose 7-phosphate isomerase